jgi:hypothetical protein
VAFKITNRLKVNNDNLKFNGDFKSHITVKKTPGKIHNISPYKITPNNFNLKLKIILKPQITHNAVLMNMSNYPCGGEPSQLKHNNLRPNQFGKNQ